MKKLKYLKLHNEFVENGQMSEAGLCAVFSGTDGYPSCLKKFSLFELFLNDPLQEGILWWGVRGDRAPSESLSVFREIKSYTPLRQNIVLLLAAMNNEL